MISLGEAVPQLAVLRSRMRANRLALFDLWERLPSATARERAWRWVEEGCSTAPCLSETLAPFCAAVAEASEDQRRAPHDDRDHAAGRDRMINDANEYPCPR
jgi:hypothetical protein